MTAITINALIDRKFKSGKYFKDEFTKSTRQGEHTIISIEIDINNFNEVTDIDIKTETKKDHFHDSEVTYISLPVSTSLEDIDHLIRILNL